jgi:hypothetical protein
MTASCFAAFVVLLALAGRPAAAVEARDLVGWWMSIDATYFPMQIAGFTVPSEEVLIVKEDGRIENRFMMFYDPQEDDCRSNGNCRDMPLGAHGRAVLTGDSLSFADKVDTSEVLQSPNTDQIVRLLLVMAKPQWRVILDNGSLRLIAPGGATRVFARVTPEKLIRLRAGFLMAEVSATQHWRCFLANGVAGDPAFAPMHHGKAAAARDLPALMLVASYEQTLRHVMSRFHAKEQAPAGDPVAMEHLLIEAFPGAAAPTSAEEAAPLQAAFLYLRLRLKGLPHDEAEQAAKERLGGKSPSLAVEAATIEAALRLLADEAERKRLWCDN